MTGKVEMEQDSDPDYPLFVLELFMILTVVVLIISLLIVYPIKVIICWLHKDCKNCQLYLLYCDNEKKV